MAKIDYINLVRGVFGRLSKSEKKGSVQRQKTFRDEFGNIIGYGVKETYIVAHPRDYKKKPPVGAESANITAFQQAALQSKKELADPERRAYWNARWHAQFKKGEKDAPISPITHQPKIYLRLDKFVVAVLYRDIKNSLTQ